MPRILYLLPGQGSIQGGTKVIVRHVEALRRLGFDAYCVQGTQNRPPPWLDHAAPFIDSPLRDDDILVAPDDATFPLKALSTVRNRTFVLAQNPYYCAMLGFESLDLYPPDRLPTMMAVSEGLKATMLRAYPAADIHLVPCFADERLFRPAAKAFRVVYPPKKRELEARFIRELFRKLHPRHAALEWVALERMREPEVADAMGGASLFLSLSRFESVGMTTLEAMACGCVCAGFTGVGGAQYATSENGFWVPDDDCVAATDALAQAADLVCADDGAAERMREAGYEAAASWSYARFVEALVAFWMRFAPDARSA